MAIAAMLAWFVARQVDAEQSYIAPYVAVFMMSETVYRSLLTAGRQLAAIITGILVAFAAITIITHEMLALGVAVFAGMLLGQWQRFGESGVWVGAIALFMLAQGTADEEGFLLTRVLDSVIGAVVGTAVNVLVLPPVYLRDTRRAVAMLSDEIHTLLSTVANELRGEWTPAAARSWTQQARRLESSVAKAQDTAGWGRESTWLNPRWRLDYRREFAAEYEAAVHALHEVSREVQRITDALSFVPDVRDIPTDFGTRFDHEVASLLDQLADGVLSYRQPRDRRSEATAACVSSVLQRTEELNGALTTVANTNGPPARETLSVHGELLHAIERTALALGAESAT